MLLKKEIEEIIANAGFEQEIIELKECARKYCDRYIKMIKPQEKQPNRTLGQNGLNYLQLELYRSKLLFEGSIDSLNNSNILVEALCTRAQFEVTGGLALFILKLRSFYKKNIQYEQIDDFLYKLTLGSKLDEVSELASRSNFKAINVLDMIDAGDKLFCDGFSKKKPVFRTMYDTLSEFCHPNAFGNLIGSSLDSDGIMRYYDTPQFREDELFFVRHLTFSCTTFFYFYDMAYKILEDKEELPIIIN
jgi:hypothetical protein